MFARRSIRPGILFALLTLLLVACDPAAPHFTVILQVAGSGDAVVAYAVRRRGWGPGCCTYGEPTYFSSQDGGLTWHEIGTPPPELEQKLREAKARFSEDCEPDGSSLCTRIDGLGRVYTMGLGPQSPDYPYSGQEQELAHKSLDYRPACSSTNPQQCFRLGEQGQIEHSLDSGATWQVDWDLHAGRRAFQARSLRGLPVDTRPLDLAVLDRPEGTSVIAAMGNQGILVRTPQGMWEPRPVDAARPLPTRAKGLGEALRIVSGEAARSALAALGVGVLNWVILTVATPKGARRPKAGLAGPLLVFVAAFLPHLLWALAALPGRTATVWLSRSLGGLVTLLTLAHAIRLAVQVRRA
jgi:hypothetical protein